MSYSLPDVKEFDPMSYRPAPSREGTTSLGANYEQEPEHDDTLQDFIDEIDGPGLGYQE
jgi:hypothetical protein